MSVTFINPTEITNRDWDGSGRWEVAIKLGDNNASNRHQIGFRADGTVFYEYLPHSGLPKTVAIPVPAASLVTEKGSQNKMQLTFVNNKSRLNINDKGWASIDLADEQDRIVGIGSRWYDGSSPVPIAYQGLRVYDDSK